MSVDQKDLQITKIRTSIAKLNTKRFSRFRYNLFLNFVSLVVIFQSLKINNLFTSFTFIMLFMLLVLISLIVQAWVYFTKLDLYNYKHSLTNSYLRIYWYREFISIMISISVIFMSHSNMNANIVYLIINFIISLINISIYLWANNKFITNKDKYYNAIKNAYLSLPKKHR